MYYNMGRFQLDEYQNQRIEKSSRVESVQFDEFRPSWIGAEIVINELADETTLIQYGI